MREEHKVLAVLLAVALAAWIILQDASVDTFEECVEAGYEILYPDCMGCPRQCVTPEGRTFTE